MKKPSTNALGKMKQSQEDAMGDVCNIYRDVYSTGTYSDDEVTSTTTITAVECGFYFTNGVIKYRGQNTLVDYDVVLRLPTDQITYLTDRIELVMKGDVPVSGTFQPMEYPEYGATAQIIHLRRTT